ncbi:MAG TPA: SgcJ/EcaC family oxidoreductase [Kofleriaceae bacterium]|jgi:uncharacterized protein (TIGR02246 family)
MKHPSSVSPGYLLSLAVVLTACGGTNEGAGTAPRTHADRTSIEAVLERYETALNTSDTNAAVGIYGDGAIFMPQGSSPAVGLGAIRQAYDQIFAAVGLHVTFTIDEVKLLGDTAWVRTHSIGEMVVRGAGIHVPGKNSELFIFEKQKSGEWRVARYLFATQLSPKS